MEKNNFKFFLNKFTKNDGQYTLKIKKNLQEKNVLEVLYYYMKICKFEITANSKNKK